MRTPFSPAARRLLRHSRMLPCILTIAAAACSTPSAETAGGASVSLHGLFADYWEFQLAENPLLATSAGDHRANDRLPSVTVEAEARRAQAARGFLERLEAFDPEALSEQDRISRDILLQQLETRIRDFELGGYRLPLTVDNGFHIAFARLPTQVPLTTVEDYENYTSRLRDFPRYVDEHIALLQEGLESRMTLARVILEGYEVTIESHIVDDPTRSVLYGPFGSFPTTVAAGDTARLRAAGRSAIEEAVVPGYRSFLDFMQGEYMPGARTTIGAFEMPGGLEYYAHTIREFTTLDDLGAEEIHALGLSEVARIRSEMEAIIEEVDFRGSFADFLHFLRTDPRFYARTPEELLKEAAFIAKDVDGKLPTLFNRLPRQPYGIEPVPDHLAPKYTGGRYVGAPLEGTRAGFYWLNTYDLPSRPLYVLPALTLHEAAPGHHLQNALRQEMEDVPDFRRYTSNSAFGEGWGLYSELLGVEMGVYRTPYEQFGRLTYEMWRACRLVVDTGMHQMGWSRQQAMDFMADNTALSLHEIRTETDRYISWPGQALAYKMGELKFRELRARAEAALGEEFDVRAFHDVVLQNGSVPLTVLEGVVDRWIARSQN